MCVRVRVCVCVCTVCDNIMLAFRFKKTLEKRRVPSCGTEENDE